MDALPANLHEGMIVVDRDMNLIGKVETFRASDENPHQPGPETVTGSPIVEQDRNTLTSILADVFRPDDDLPREMQEKLLRDGFIRVDGEGLFAADRYVFPEQIERVEGDRIVLKVPREKLFRA